MVREIKLEEREDRKQKTNVCEELHAFFSEITGYLRKMTSKSSSNLDILLFSFPVKENFRSKYL